MDIDELLAQLTVAEKASLTLGSDFWHTAAIERLDVPAVMVSDGPHGLRAQVAEELQGRKEHVIFALPKVLRSVHKQGSSLSSVEPSG